METSRVFIRGLPPSLAPEEFEKHFSTSWPVTDTKFLPRRRIGYVGYKTHEDAVKAVRYFNKSFIRMSRIGVELARPITDQENLEFQDSPADTVLQAVSRDKVDASGPKSAKRKHDTLHQTREEPDAKLQEFLEVMKPSSKSHTWANEYTQGSHAADSAKVRTTLAEDAVVDNEYKPMPEKKRARIEEKQVQEIPESTIANNLHIYPPEIAHQESEQRDVEVAKAASDADWLRSRTSRLLGLIDDDENAIGSAKSRLPHGDHGVEESQPIGVDRISRSDVGSQTNDEDRENDCKDITFSTSPNETEMNTGRLFVRNLAYSALDADLRAHFEKHGNIEEIHMPMDNRSGRNKGFAYVQYADPQEAKTARKELDGQAFQGRLLHILAAEAKKDGSMDEFAISKLPLKKQKQIKQKAEAASSTFNWNSMFMNTDAVISSISERLGISKSALLEPTSSDAAVRQAHAETNVIQGTKAYFTANGVNLDAFKKGPRHETAMLLKNFPYGTTSEELRKLFYAYGTVIKLLLPPAGTIAVVELEQASQARSAFSALAYRKFKDTILFLEKAPKDIFNVPELQQAEERSKDQNRPDNRPSAKELLQGEYAAQPMETSTLFVRNLNFSTSTERLRETFHPLDGFLSARVKTKANPKKPGQVLSMGYGFVEFRSKQQAQAALAAMDGYSLDGHDLHIKSSHKALDAAEERRKEDQAKKITGRRTKIIIKNLPFEASKKDVRSLFGPYGQLRSVRMPKKFDNSTRGFAFANFVTVREAENAMDALKDTHLLGRRLVLEFAAEDAIDPDEELEKMQQKVGKQADRVALQRLTGTGRKKFRAGQDEFSENAPK